MDGSGVFWWLAGAVLLAALVAAVVLAVKLVKVRRMLGSSGVPMSGKVLFWASLVYLVSPVDLLPDPVLLDDVGLLLIALRTLGKAAAHARHESA
ncbi:DUF1232 domain-containing protein [Kitasatospora sp. NPDC054939]